jgi:hypothetical protein
VLPRAAHEQLDRSGAVRGSDDAKRDSDRDRTRSHDLDSWPTPCASRTGRGWGLVVEAVVVDRAATPAVGRWAAAASAGPAGAGAGRDEVACRSGSVRTTASLTCLQSSSRAESSGGDAWLVMRPAWLGQRWPRAASRVGRAERAAAPHLLSGAVALRSRSTTPGQPSDGHLHLLSCLLHNLSNMSSQPPRLAILGAYPLPRLPDQT